MIVKIILLLLIKFLNKLEFLDYIKHEKLCTALTYRYNISILSSIFSFLDCSLSHYFLSLLSTLLSASFFRFERNPNCEGASNDVNPAHDQLQGDGFCNWVDGHGVDEEECEDKDHDGKAGQDGGVDWNGVNFRFLDCTRFRSKNRRNCWCWL